MMVIVNPSVFQDCLQLHPLSPDWLWPHCSWLLLHPQSLSFRYIYHSMPVTSKCTQLRNFKCYTSESLLQWNLLALYRLFTHLCLRTDYRTRSPTDLQHLRYRCMKNSRKKITDHLVDSCKHSSVNRMAAGSRLLP